MTEKVYYPLCGPGGPAEEMSEGEYQLAYGANRTINNSAVIDDGTYRFISHALTLSLGYHF